VSWDNKCVGAKQAGDLLNLVAADKSLNR